MTFWFFIQTRVGKFIANMASSLVPDREKRHQLRSRLDPLNPERCVAYLEKYYTQCEPLASDDRPAIENAIWVCWLQGLDKAPRLVQNCVRSIERHKRREQRLIVVTADNYADYVEMPATIIEKWKTGKMCNAHFSDLFRVLALARHGGLWIDATCYQTAPIPQHILGSDLFMFRSHGEFSFTYIQNCFLHARRNNYVMRKWGAAMLAYWEHENRAINYFVHHLLFIALLHKDPQFLSVFNSMAVMSEEPMHFLLHKMKQGDSYSKQLMDEACRKSFIHKLTYKFPAALLDRPDSIASVFSQSDFND